MPVLDGSYLTQALLDAVEEGVNLGLKQIQSQAKKHAPVRDIFKHGRGRLETVEHHLTSGSVQTLRSAGGAPQFMSAKQAQGSGFYTRGSYSSHQGSVLKQIPTYGKFGDQGQPRWDEDSSRLTKGEGRYVVGKGTIRGRPNSYAPVVQSPAGFIGGANFRHWAGPNALEVGLIRSPKGGRFELASLLSARGRYEAFGKGRTGKGRAVRMVNGKAMIGGALHDGITIEGPFRNGAEVYGFVRAVAHDPGRTHNYAKDQEFGSRHNKAQPFLRPGLRESKERIIKMVDPAKGQRGLLQRAIQTGARSPGGSSEVGVPVKLIVKVDFSDLVNDFFGKIRLEGS